MALVHKFGVWYSGFKWRMWWRNYIREVEIQSTRRNTELTTFSSQPLFQNFWQPNSPTICTPPQFLLIHNSHWDSCINTVGDSIYMTVQVFQNTYVTTNKKTSRGDKIRKYKKASYTTEIYPTYIAISARSDKIEAIQRYPNISKITNIWWHL